MDSVLAAAGGALAALLAVGLVALAVRTRRGRRTAELEQLLLAAQREADDLRARLDELTSPGSSVLPGARSGQERPVAEYVITDIGAAPAEQPVPVPDRLVLSATLGVPLVKAAALAHGLRRALSPQSRNRIRFEMRQEVRAARKRRKRAVREHLRTVRAQQRAGEGA